MSFTMRTTLGLTCGIYLAAGTVLAGVGPALARLATNTGQDIAALGGLFTGIAAGGVLAQFVVSPLSERLGQRPVLLGGMLLLSGGMIGVSLSGRLGVLLLCALLAGLGFGGVLAGANVLVARLFPARSAAVLNLINLCFGVGSILSPVVAGLAAARLDLPQAALWLGAGLLLAQAPLVLRYATPAPAAHGEPAGTLRAAAASPTLWLISLILLVYTGVEIGMGGWAMIYLQRGAGLEPAAAALAATTFWAALTLGRGMGALIGLRVPPHTLLRTGLLGMTAGAAVLWLSVGTLGPTLLGLGLFGLACGPIFPTAIALTATLSRGSPSAVSLVLAVGNLGGLAIPALLGVVITGAGPAAGAALLLGAGAAMLALFAGLAAIGRPRQAAPGR